MSSSDSIISEAMVNCVLRLSTTNLPYCSNDLHIIHIDFSFLLITCIEYIYIMKLISLSLGEKRRHFVLLFFSDNSHVDRLSANKHFVVYFLSNR